MWTVQLARETRGAFHLPTIFRYFGQKSNGKVHFSSVLTDYLFFFACLTSQTEVYCFILTNCLATSLQFSSLSQMGGKECKMEMSLPLSWPGFIRKCHSILQQSVAVGLTSWTVKMESTPELL